jgi:hypothetical protein
MGVFFLYFFLSANKSKATSKTAGEGARPT